MAAARRRGAAASGGRSAAFRPRLAAGRHVLQRPSASFSVLHWSLVAGRWSLVGRYGQATRASVKRYRQAQHISATYQRGISAYAHTHTRIYIIKSSGRLEPESLEQFKVFRYIRFRLNGRSSGQFRTVLNNTGMKKKCVSYAFSLAIRFERPIMVLSDDDGRHCLI